MRAGGQTVEAVGEFGLIARVVARLGAPPPPAGPGDDAAVVPAPDGRVVATTDLLVEGRHFRRNWSTAAQVGRRAAAANLADVAAMGAVPSALLVGIAAPADLPVVWCEELADGLRAECIRAGAIVVGGDVVRSDGVVTLAVTALGDLRGRVPVRRSGARAGDVVVVVGRLGWAAAGLAVLERDDGGLTRRHPGVVEALTAPVPVYAAGPLLADAGASALCDVSDGLLADLGHIAEASGVGVELAALPVDPEVAAAATDLGVHALVFVAQGGDDHAFVATLARADVARAVKAVQSLGDGTRLWEVGQVSEGSGVHGVELSGAGGFDHFGGSSS